jgi:hypothetical protein
VAATTFLDWAHTVFQLHPQHISDDFHHYGRLDCLPIGICLLGRLRQATNMSCSTVNTRLSVPGEMRPRFRTNRSRSTVRI